MGPSSWPLLLARVDFGRVGCAWLPSRPAGVGHKDGVGCSLSGPTDPALPSKCV